MEDSNDLTCQELVEIVSDYLEGVLPASDLERFEAHLRTCDGCTTYLEQMRTTIRFMGTLREDGVDPVAREHLLQVFRDWNRV
jgi:anti-sigma factor RsiW